MMTYQQRIQHYELTIDQLDQRLQRLSILRLTIFLSAASLIFLLANQRFLSLLLAIIPLSSLAFGWIYKRYNQTLLQRQRFAYLRQINQQELDRLDNNLTDFPTGQAFIDRQHAYLADIDIFGTHSLFQLLNRTTTELGMSQLAQWLAQPAAKDIILERQQAIRELTPNLDWRQAFQASGMPFTNTKSSYAQLLSWVKKPVQLLPRKRTYLLLGISLACLTIITVTLFIRHLVEFIYMGGSFSSGYLAPFLLALLINRLVLRRVKPLAEDIIDSLRHQVKTLAGYKALIEKIESEVFKSHVLQGLQASFRQDHYSAVVEINQLKTILEVFQHRATQKSSIGGNDFYRLFNNLFLLDIYWILLTENWKHKNQLKLESWAWAVSEFEVFSSLAGFAYSNPTFKFPQIREERYWIDFKELGHPLIRADQRVYNDFSLRGRGAIVMITGSNMAGKSTFLRTLGINVFLALLGAPCCMSCGQVSSLQLFTSMRTQDNLAEGVSSFYAELKRIEQLLTLLKSDQAVLFLLDEMFKGTNSQDRYKGGVSLIRQLTELNAFGLISTHDLTLANVASSYLAVTNYSFNSKLRDSEMLFDYKLRPGLCRDFNASALMKASGIHILSDLEDLSL
ncbi:MutS family DNA mismatch repair protein [Spirosoma humi]